MLKTLQVVGLSSLTGLAVLSFADAAAAQLNVNINFGGSRQPVYVVPSPPSQRVYGVPTPQTQPVYGVQPGAVRVRCAITAKSPIRINRSMSFPPIPMGC